jgi:uncharacterized delta-60 repeat protein
MPQFPLRLGSPAWLVGALVFLTSLSRAQVVLDSFDPNANGTVRAIVVQPDGKIIISGDFTTVGGTNRHRIARLNADGTVDSTFDASIDDRPYVEPEVRALALQPDGKILAAGDFLTVNGQSRSNIVRLNTDGTLDSSFSSSLAFGIQALALQPDGKIVTAGASSPGISRLNTNGTIDSSFSRTAGAYSLALQTDGRVVIGGALQQSLPYTYMRRLAANGTNDPSFQSSMSDTFVEYGGVFTIVIQPDQKILIGGSFTQVGGQQRAGFARLNSNGSVDTSFVPPTVWSAKFVLQPNGKIVAAGDMTGTNGYSETLVARFNPNGTRDTSFPFVAASSVQSLALQPDGKILVGGDFSIINGVPRNRVARLSSLSDPDFVHGPMLVQFRRMGGGIFRFNATELGQTNFPMTIVASTDPAAPSATWTDVGPLRLGVAASYFEFTDPVAATNASQRYYRLRF